MIFSSVVTQMKILVATFFPFLSLVHSGQNYFSLGMLLSLKQVVWNHIIWQRSFSHAINSPDFSDWQKHQMSCEVFCRKCQDACGDSTKEFSRDFVHHYPRISGRTPYVKKLVAFSRASERNTFLMSILSTMHKFIFTPNNEITKNGSTKLHLCLNLIKVCIISFEGKFTTFPL